MSITFSIVHETKHGPSVESDNPKLNAYKYAAMLVDVQRRRYQMVCHEDGSFTVNSDGLMPMTFVKGAA